MRSQRAGSVARESANWCPSESTGQVDTWDPFLGAGSTAKHLMMLRM